MLIKERGFTFPEVTMGLALLTIILGLTFFAFRHSIDSFQETELTIHLTEGLHSGLNILRRDLRETGINTISFLTDADPDFPNSRAWTMARARRDDIYRTFVITDLYQADWQGVVIYAPFQRDAHSPRELRRYVIYETTTEYTFPFDFIDVTGHPTYTIRIRDRHESAPVELLIDRRSGKRISGPGTTTTPAFGPKFRVVSSMVAHATIYQIESVANIYLRTEGKGSRGETLFREISAGVHPRN